MPKVMNSGLTHHKIKYPNNSAGWRRVYPKNKRSISIPREKVADADKTKSSGKIVYLSKEIFQ